jgi:hypothetical protein
MSRLITTIVILSLLGGTAAIAQNSGANGKSSASIPQAPVGHRQPTKADVSGADAKDKGLLGADADDKALDRKIKSICRGC